MKKLLVSDYDNTFYLNELDIKNNIKNVNIFRKNGNLFAIATGRSFLDIMNDITKFNIKFDYLIINHGNTILNNKKEVIFSSSIDKDIQRILIEKLDLKNDNTSFCCSVLDSRVSALSSNLTKIHKKFNTLQQAITINNKINNIYNLKVTSYLIKNYNAVEIIPSNIDKSKAICKIAKIENISKNNIFTIGDSYNDIEMIKEFNGACIKDSEKEIQEVANYKYNSVSELLSAIMEE